ncbi:very long-chain acyl-CoA synthetase-like isoform X1 [Denticeps clupeoides]|uniref:very long-chain acyl-CoA synthetase-like isoform X1 n=1 Tax=Denticeps clupeoides TaxID=299321 RepID=UPI0010A36729|nr:very long-chain acyl-CoA synthetase-like isoform X1 [Denticeps clupeoides]
MASSSLALIFQGLCTALAGVVLVVIFLNIQFPYLLQDCKFCWTLFKVKQKRAVFRKRKPFYTVLDCFLNRVRTRPDKPLLVFEGREYSYQDCDKESNKIARALRKHGNLTQGDTVALFLGNEPRFVWMWLGLCKLGCAASLLNYNIRAKSLLHCFSCCGAKVLIVAEELKEAVEEVLPTLLEQKASVFILSKECNTAGLQTLVDKIEEASNEPISPELRSNVTMGSPAVYIYTSGTTGFPKAAVMTQERIWAGTFYLFINGASSEDVIYIPLPLYHAAGFVIGLHGAIQRGMTVVLRRKFSVSQFWDDCRKHNVTIIQYIGETMRYLCNTPKRESDKMHKVRMAIGNGLREEVWRSFQSRFGHIRIVEFYAASDSNIGFINYIGKIGAVGRENFYQKRFFPHALIQFDAERGEPARDSNGLCIPMPQGETGLLVAKITTIAPFIEYARNPEQTEKKKIRDVFQKGDAYLNTGDLLRIDKDNFVYFQDRIGDTFRWKGENVATTEIEDVLTALDFIKDACVYGVKVPGTEGRAGMAAVTLKSGSEFDGTEAFSHIASYLPSYARPQFIRIQNSLEITGTFKQVKVKLVGEGFNLTIIKDPLYLHMDKDKCYKPMTMNYYNSIITGKMHI